MKMYFIQDRDAREPSQPTPRRRSHRGGMHAGWECFMCALGAGFFGALAMVGAIQWALHKQTVGTVIAASIASLALFIVGGRKAENLTEREP